MTGGRIVISIVVLAVIGLLCAPLGGALVGSGDSTVTNDSADRSNTSMGDEVSTFMQSNDVTASEHVDSSLFDSVYEHADNETRAALIDNRTGTYETRLEELEAEYDALTDQQDELNPNAYEARMTRLAVQLSTLQHSSNDTATRAQNAGMNTSTLETIRENASTLTGPEVAEHARGVGGNGLPSGPPDHAGNADGPPGLGDDANGGGEESDDGDRNESASGDRNGPPTDDDDRRGPPADDS